MITIYGLVDPREPGRVRYVGRTKCPKRRLTQHRAFGVGDARRRWVRHLRQSGTRPDMIVLAQVDEGVARQTEYDFIRRYPPKDLLNSQRAFETFESGDSKVCQYVPKGETSTGTLSL